MNCGWLVLGWNARVMVTLMVITFIFQGCSKDKLMHDGFVKVDGAEIYYKSIGKGEPIVVIHGGPGMGYNYFLPQMEKLAENHRLIFYDQRGVGKSTTPINSQSITLENFIEDIESLRKELKLGKMNLLGHSFGGQLAMFYGIKYPENLKSLVLVCPAAASSDFWKPFSINFERKISAEDREKLNGILNSTAYKNKTPEAFQEYYHVYFRPYFMNPENAEKLNLQVTELTAMNSDTISVLLSPDLSEYDIHADLANITCPSVVSQAGRIAHLSQHPSHS